MSEAISEGQGDCEQALVDVRKACRLLLLFHRRVRTLCQEMSKYISYKPYWIESPMGHSMDPELVFTPTMRRMYLPIAKSNDSSNGDHMLEFIIQADSMFEDFANGQDTLTPDDSKSRIMFRVYKNKSLNPRNWLVISRTYHHSLSDQDVLQVSSDQTVEAYSKWFNFCDLCDQSSIQAAVDLFMGDVKTILDVQL
jgi:hypothetical protein